MTAKIARIALILLTAFDALTAIGGGLAMLTGLDRFPPEWLQGTPFNSYTVPALILTLVGASALAAAGLTIAQRPAGLSLSMAAGILMSGYQVVEVLLLNDDPWISGIETFYFVLGGAILLLAVYLQPAKNRLSLNRHRSTRHA